MRPERIPVATVARLPLYLRELEELAAEGLAVVSSQELARRVGFTSEQIRKDLAYFGSFGTRGIGYQPAQLAAAIRRILGLDVPAPVVVLGAGNLGTALIRHLATREKDLTVVAAFDAAPARVGQSVDGCPVYPVEELEARLTAHPVKIAVLAVPPEAAPSLFQRLKALGVEAVLNFSPHKLSDGRVFVKNLDLTTELQALVYYAHGREGAS